MIQLGRNEGILTLLLTHWYYLDLLTDTLISLMVTSSILYLYRKIDTQYPFTHALLHRLFYQFVCCMMLPCLAIVLLTWGAMALVWQQDIRETSFFTYEFQFVVLIVLLINVWLSLVSLWDIAFERAQQVAETDHGTRKLEVDKTDTLLIESGEKIIPLAIHKIGLCLMGEEGLCIYTTDGRAYRYAGTLESLESLLPAFLFFRVNRQAIVHRSSCQHFIVQRSGKIDLFLSHPAVEQLAISQKRAADFKIWIQKSLTSV
jgi:hypothetical protein